LRSLRSVKFLQKITDTVADGDYLIFQQRNRRIEPHSGFSGGNLDPEKRHIRCRSFSGLELEAQEEGAAEDEALLEEEKMRRLRRETFAEKCHRYRGVIFVICVPLALMSVVLVLMPRVVDPRNAAAYDANFDLPSNNLRVPKQKRYAVIFDAGSSGSRVHVFSFDENLQLVKVGSELEVFEQKKPGLSSYALNPKEGAESLQSLLDVALESVPAAHHATTPVLLGATAGLRLLPGDQSKNLLQEVTTLLENSAFKFKPEWVSIIDGTQEGSYQWVTVNYLLNRLGKPFDKAVGIVDLGGGSVQMAYAISDDDFSSAPKPKGKDQAAYVRKMELMGASYNLYVHSYLNYGLLAARAEVLKLVGEADSCPCLGAGHEGSYSYGGQKYKATASADGGDYLKCKHLVVKALKVDAACDSMKCTFGGVWNGGGGPGINSLFVASFFFDRAVEAGIVKNGEAAEAVVTPKDFEAAAKKICGLSLAELAEQYRNVQADTRKFLCMDLTYQYALLVTGFQVEAGTKMTLVKKVKYRGSYVETAWPLGSAIELVSLNKV
jgi:apyrase